MTNLDEQITIEDERETTQEDQSFGKRCNDAMNAEKEGEPWNLEALKNTAAPVFIVSTSDNAIVYEHFAKKQNAVALNGIKNVTQIKDAIKKARGTLQGVIISLPDEEIEATADIERALDEVKIKRYTTDGIIEPGVHPEAIGKALSALFGDFSVFSVADHKESFKAERKEAYSRPAIKTGFYTFDEELKGGLFPGLYTIGAEPGAGKTAFIMQIADHIAENGKPVLVYALEMGKSQLEARSISRITAEKKTPKEAATALEILAGGPDGWNEEKKDVIEQAYNEYFDKHKQLYIVEGRRNTTAARIENDIKNFTMCFGEAPVLFVDYLQILAPMNERGTDKQNADQAVQVLYDISRTYKTPVFVVSSWNRSAYGSAGGMEAFKESGGIEYGADVLITLQLKDAIDAAGNSAGKPRETQAKAIRDAVAEARRSEKPLDIVLSFLKNRYAAPGGTLDFSFDAAHSLFKACR